MWFSKVDMEGLTGQITFDRGRRYEFKLDILQLNKDAGLKKVLVLLFVISLFVLLSLLLPMHIFTHLCNR